MNYLLRVLQLIVCLCFGVASMAAYGYGMDDRAGDYRNRGGYDLFEAAWECEPVFYADKIVNWQVGSKYIQGEQSSSGGWEFTDEFKTELYNTLLEFRGCSDQAINNQLKGMVNSEQLREHFINAYVTFDYGFKKLFSVTPRYEDSRLEKILHFVPHEINHSGDDLLILQVKVSSAFFRDQKHHEEVVLKREEQRVTEQRKQEAEKAAEIERKHQAELAKQALVNRAQALKAGTAKVVSLSDAILLNDPASLLPLMDNPLLTSDGKYYVGNVLIEAQEGELIRVQGMILMGQMGEISSKTYAYLKMPKNSMNFSVEGMRIGGTTAIVGKYVGNINYRTVSGVTKTAPVIECHYYASVENNNDRLWKQINQQLRQ